MFCFFLNKKDRTAQPRAMFVKRLVLMVFSFLKGLRVKRYKLIMQTNFASRISLQIKTYIKVFSVHNETIHGQVLHVSLREVLYRVNYKISVMYRYVMLFHSLINLNYSLAFIVNQVVIRTLLRDQRINRNVLVYFKC